MCQLDQDLAELSSAEDFLEYFGVDYNPDVVRVKRLHILQRFHDYLQQAAPLPESAGDRRATYATWLRAAYQDFVYGDVRTEKALRVFQTQATPAVQVPLSQLLESRCDHP